MKVNKDRRTCIRLENNDYEIISILARQENKSVSQILREQIKQIIEKHGGEINGYLCR